MVGRERVAFLHHDSYYRDLAHLPLEERAKTNFDHPNSLETSLLVEHLKQLKQWKPAQVPIYDFKVHCRRPNESHEEHPRTIIVVEGILIFVEPELRELLDIKIFVDTDDDIRFIRRYASPRRIRRETIWQFCFLFFVSVVTPAVCCTE